MYSLILLIAEENTLTFFKLTSPEFENVWASCVTTPASGASRTKQGQIGKGGFTGRKESRASLIQKSKITLEYSDVGDYATILDSIVDRASIRVRVIHD